jgi:hypothetical protein
MSKSLQTPNLERERLAELKRAADRAREVRLREERERNEAEEARKRSVKKGGVVRGVEARKAALERGGTGQVSVGFITSRTDFRPVPSFDGLRGSVGQRSQEGDSDTVTSLTRQRMGFMKKVFDETLGTERGLEMNGKEDENDLGLPIFTGNQPQYSAPRRLRFEPNDAEYDDNDKFKLNSEAVRNFISNRPDSTKLRPSRKVYTQRMKGSASSFGLRVPEDVARLWMKKSPSQPTYTPPQAKSNIQPNNTDGETKNTPHIQSGVVSVKQGYQQFAASSETLNFLNHSPPTQVQTPTTTTSTSPPPIFLQTSPKTTPKHLSSSGEATTATTLSSRLLDPRSRRLDAKPISGTRIPASMIRGYTPPTNLLRQPTLHESDVRNKRHNNPSVTLSVSCM